MENEKQTQREKGHTHRGKYTQGRLDVGAVLAALDLRAGQTVLDAGCGNGYMAREFAQKVGDGGRVFAVDEDARAIEAFTRENADRPVTALAGDITRPTGVPGSSVDLVYLSTVFHGFSRDQASGFLQEVRRVLKPGGRLAIVEFDKKEMSSGPPLGIRLSPEELKKVVAWPEAGNFRAGEHFYLQVFEKN